MSSNEAILFTTRYLKAYFSYSRKNSACWKVQFITPNFKFGIRAYELLLGIVNNLIGFATGFTASGLGVNSIRITLFMLVSKLIHENFDLSLEI